MQIRNFMAFLAALALMQAIFAQSDINLKLGAINATAGSMVKIDQYTAYDNFIGKDGVEYVVVIVDKPSLLLTLKKSNGAYAAALVSDNSTIRRVIEQRYAQYKSEQKGVQEIAQEAHSLIAQFNRSRFFGESKYKMVLGMANSSCLALDECRQDCLSSPVCAYAYSSQGDAVIDDVLAYSKITQGMDALAQRELEFSQKQENISETGILDTYADIISGLEKGADQMSNAKLQSPDSMLYLGQMGYNASLLFDARQLVQDARAPAEISDQMENTIRSIQGITSIYAPKPEAAPTASEGQAAQSNGGQAQANKTENQNGQNASNEENLPPASPVQDNAGGIKTGDIILYCAIGLVLALAIVLAYAGKKEGKGFGLFSKKPKSLEDLG